MPRPGSYRDDRGWFKGPSRAWIRELPLRSGFAIVIRRPGKLRKIGSVKLAYLLGVAVERSAVRLHDYAFLRSYLWLESSFTAGRGWHVKYYLIWTSRGHPRPNTPRPLHGRIGSLTNLVIYKLSPNTTLGQLFALFDAPQHQPLLFYYARAHLLRATRVQLRSAAAEHIALVAALFGLLKEEGLRWDGPDGEDAFGNTIVFPTLRELVRRVQRYPRTPRGTRTMGPYSRWLQESSYVVPHKRVYEGLLRPGGERPRPVLLRALEDPIQPEVWETLWAAVLRCEEKMAYGAWGAGSEYLAPFKDAARTIAAEGAVGVARAVCSQFTAAASTPVALAVAVFNAEHAEDDSAPSARGGGAERIRNRQYSSEVIHGVREDTNAPAASTQANTRHTRYASP
ncbi:hypothetical protein B0H11DRAFT_2426697 [Mycena galericulata]|nr:hypothetical protein B0H11DRAFT_2426697 [Mycena galericulata]